MAKRELVATAIQYCYQNMIHLEFIRIAEAQGLDADGLAETIIKSLRKVEAQTRKCVGQGYDGFTVVTGHLNSVQQKIPAKTTTWHIMFTVSLTD